MNDSIIISKLKIAITGLKAIIEEGSVNSNIAQKTLEAIDSCKGDSPQESE